MWWPSTTYILVFVYSRPWGACAQNSSQPSADFKMHWKLEPTFSWPWRVLRNQADLQLTFMRVLKNQAFSWQWHVPWTQAFSWSWCACMWVEESGQLSFDSDVGAEESNQLSASSWCVCWTIKPTFSLTSMWVEESSRLSAWSEPVSFPLWNKVRKKQSVTS